MKATAGRDFLFLISPPAPGLLAGFASSLLSLASHVAQALPDVELRLLDLSDCPMEALGSRAEELLAGLHGRAFVGITTCTATYQAALEVARAFKMVSSEVVVVLGGHHASPQDEVVLRCHPQLIDGVLRGEGERAVVELLARYPDLDGVPNLTHRVGALVRRAPNAPLLRSEELDRLGPIFQPAFEGGAAPPGKFGRATYISARGCPLGSRPPPGAGAAPPEEERPGPRNQSAQPLPHGFGQRRPAHASGTTGLLLVRRFDGRLLPDPLHGTRRNAHLLGDLFRG